MRWFGFGGSTRSMCWVVCAVCMAVGVVGVPAEAADDIEVAMPADDWKRLDTFEAEALRRADRSYGERNYLQAFAEYDAFILEYPRSLAVPYALMRKGRTRHLVDKRYEAIEIYTEVLDYFPDDIPYAAASLFYIGQCHQENGNPVEAMKAYAEMVQDKDYRESKLAAPALLALAANMMAQSKPDDAMRYYRRVAVEFRTRMHDAAKTGIDKVVYHFVRRSPDEAQLRQFYVDVRGFDWHPIPKDKMKPVGELASDMGFANLVCSYVNRYGSFQAHEKEHRDKYYRYWTSIFENKFTDSDGFQISIFNWIRIYENDTQRWIGRVDKQFNRGEKNLGRILWFMQQCWKKDHPEKVTEYYNLVDFSSMDNAAILSLMRTLWDSCGQGKMAANLLEKLDYAKMNDKDKEELVKYLFSKGHEDGARTVMAQMEDQERAQYLLLTYFVMNKDVERGIPQADIVSGYPDYAEYALWEKSTFLYIAQRWEECIAVCQQVDKGSTGYYRIASCYEKLGKVEQAASQLREIETFFKEESSRACFMVAELYGRTGRRTQQVAVLREVLTKYPKSGESSQAHVLLERMGYQRTKGGEDSTQD